jgi:ADP-heptose:LPS heptosyltransferase
MPDIAHYDKYINLDDAYELNPTENYLDNYFYRAFGHTDLNQRPELFPNDEDRAAVDADLKDIGDQFIAVHMRNWHWGSKNISMDVWLEVYGKLFEQRADFKIVCVGGETDFYIEDHPLFVDLRTKYNSQQLTYLMDHAACFVGIDSGPFHCAAASKTHIVALLTHLHPDRIVPMGASYVQTNEDCRGCNDDQARPVRQLICRKGNYPCVSNFDTDAITQAILRTLK